MVLVQSLNRFLISLKNKWPVFMGEMTSPPFVSSNIVVEFLDNMASRTKSSSGAIHEEYDTTVEKRLQPPDS